MIEITVMGASKAGLQALEVILASLPRMSANGGGDRPTLSQIL